MGRQAVKIVRHVVITGQVQGVCYRAAMLDEAISLGLTGWVRNRRDGSVEAMLQGDESATLDLVAWCHQGPPAARVAAVAVSQSDGEFDCFVRLPTA